MIRKYSDLLKEQKNAPFDGTGEIMVRSLLNGPDELYHKGRVFAHTTVYPCLLYTSIPTVRIIGTIVGMITI